MDRMARLDQDELLRSAATDPAAFASVYRLFERRMLAYFMRASGRPELAADMAAETFTRALEAIGRFDPARGGAEQWLFGIARNVLASSCRTGRVDASARQRLGVPRLLVDDHAADTIARLATDEKVATVELAELPDEQRQAINARVIEEREYREIASELCCSEAVLRQRVSRGLKTLRTRLADRI